MSFSPVPKKKPYIQGVLHFSRRKTLLSAPPAEYFIREIDESIVCIEGDRVQARITRMPHGQKKAEAEILSVMVRSTREVLAEIVQKRNVTYLSLLPECGRGRIPIDLADLYNIGDIVLIRLYKNNSYTILRIFAKKNESGISEKILLYLSGVEREFSDEVLNFRPPYIRIPPHHSSHAGPLQYRSLKKMFDDTFSQDHRITQSLPLVEETMEGRVDFRNWYTLTIDGSDARDLDDALSIARYENGDFLLAVHIADVAEYVSYQSPIDREALKRATSIYLPQYVIPMLPESLSNNLCSLHPGSAKLVLTALIRVGGDGQVKDSTVCEGIIESRHRGVYEDLARHYQDSTFTNPILQSHIDMNMVLYHILSERRKNEGKILFESTELSLHLDASQIHVIEVKKRERNEMHMLIEECMILANEEIARFCAKHDLPYLSRIHESPPREQEGVIHTILGRNMGDIPLRPRDIRNFFDSLHSAEEVFRYSRLLLPKMAKAYYSDKKNQHFGLALEHYSHFTSPIRRYPDLQLHRIIKEFLHKKLNPSLRENYKRLLPRIARICTQNEKRAEDIERAMKDILLTRYMLPFVGKIFSGRISGISEFAYYVELDSGIEVMVPLSRKTRYRIDMTHGKIFLGEKDLLFSIGQKIKVEILEVLIDERKILARACT